MQIYLYKDYKLLSVIFSQIALQYFIIITQEQDSEKAKFNSYLF